MAREIVAIAMGVHVVDVLARPIESIPEGQGGQLVDEIRITPAGSAGGTAVTLAKLGARVKSAGAIGTDALGDVLIELLERFEVDTSLLRRRDGVQTSASVLPIRPDGSRAASTWSGRTRVTGQKMRPEEIAAATHLHLGGPEFMGGEEAAKILSFARERGVVTSADILAPGEQAAAIIDWIGTALEHLDYLLPNEEQVLGLSGKDDLIERCANLIGRGVGCDAFSAGFLRALALGRSRREAAVLGCATAALVAQGLGSQHGDFDLAAAEDFAARTPV